MKSFKKKKKENTILTLVIIAIKRKKIMFVVLIKMCNTRACMPVKYYDRRLMVLHEYILSWGPLMASFCYQNVLE